MESAPGSGNRPWRVERHGLEVIPERERVGTVWDLFWIWFAANLGILGVLYGAIVVGFRLNLVQDLLVIGLGSLSFVLVGYFSVAGRDGAAPMMTLSRAVFGTYGNLLPTTVSWVSLLGWEAVTVAVATMALTGLLGGLIPLPGPALALAALGVVAALVVAFGLLGQATLVVVQRWAGYVFGALTLLVAALLLPGTHWAALAHRPPGPFATGVLPALSIVVAGTSLSWCNTAADYSRYIPRQTPAGRIVLGTTAGAALPLLGLMLTGLLLATRAPQLAAAANPIAAIGQALPAWMTVPYLVTAVAGLVVEADLSLYSSGLNLLNLMVPVQRYKSVVVDAATMVGGTVYLVLLAPDFLGPFESFLILLGIGLAAWAGVFLVDQAWLRQARGGYPEHLLCAGDGPSPPAAGRRVATDAVTAWLAGVAAGLACTSSPLFNGPLAHGPFAGSSLELAVAFGTSGAILILWALGRRLAATRAPQRAAGA